MKIKKYPQSHLVITNDSGKKLIIDPGYLTFEAGFKVEDFQGADVYLITHQHSDHLGSETIKEVVQDKPVYGNSDVVAKLGEVGVVAIEVKDREEITVEGFEIVPANLPHFEYPRVVMPPNTGFLIDGIFFHPGDGWKIDRLNAANAAVPISGPEDGDIGFNQALSLARSLDAKIVIPIHYDKFPADPEEFNQMAAEAGIEVRVLNFEEETEI